ncbi:ATP-binding protein [Patescibacteria group bacterium]|nr:ATP-binding protein [Patescibacteria group bacterium]
MNFKTIIKEQREELESITKKEKIIERELLIKTKKVLLYPNTLVITGVRRCGKSIFSYLLARKKKFGYINFDDERLEGTKTEDLNKILQAFYELYDDIEYIILDEIQNVKKWELFVNRLRRTKKVIVTGSNSELLSGELATHLTGRYIDMTLFPFSFREFLRFNQVAESKAYTTKEKAKILKLLNKYLRLGGFPEVNKFGKMILIRIYNDIIIKDILLRRKIKKIDEIKKLAKYLITNFCQETTYSKLAKLLSVKQISTISNWVSYLEQSFLIFRLERFSFKLKQQFIAPKKFYCIDSGMINTIAFKFSENIGYFMENSVAMELQRKKSLNPLTEVYYWKNHQQNEVDFVVKYNKKITQLVQVTHATSKDEIKEREIKSLIKASVELKCRNLLIITSDYEGKEKINGKTINFIPLWRWLLE